MRHLRFSLRHFIWLALCAALFAGCGDDVIEDPTDGGLTDVDLTDVGDASDPADTPDAEPDAGDADTDLDADPQPDVSDDTDPGLPDTAPDADVDPEPTEVLLESVTPARGPLAGGTPFVLRGEGFGEETRVFFDIHAVEVDLIDGTLTGTTPPGEGVGPATLRVIDPVLGEDALVNGFTYFEDLSFTSVQPDRIATFGGAEVSVRGRGFTPETRVSLGGTTALRHTFISSELLRVIAPPGVAGPADLRLTNPDASLTAPNALLYVASVDLDRVDPPFGESAGDELVTIEGAGFSEAMVVYFANAPATLEAVAPDGTSATLRTPAGAPGPVDVRVELEGDGAFLADAFYYLSDTTTFSADALRPASGSSLGGDEVLIFGGGLDAAGLEITFGGQPATLVEQSTNMVRVLTPPGAPGVVDLGLSASGQPDLTLADAFTYGAPLILDALTPASGDVAGGYPLTLNGEGFTGTTEVRLGDLPQTFTVEDDTTLTITVGPGAPGPASLEVIRPDARATLADAFTFTEALELWGFEPTRGAVAGNTYVMVRGQGFTPETELTFGGAPATDVALIDANTLALRTPPGSTGEVEVRATQGAQEAVAPEPFSYFNPGARFGGAWGPPVNGSVNVTVFTHDGRPVEGAFVMLSTNANTPYTGSTNAAGMVTLSGPDVYGEQTVTATAPEHSAATAQRVDAENITLFLHPPAADGEGSFPPGPPIATFRGEVLGLDKVGIPDPDEILMAQVFSTRPSMLAQIPNQGSNNVVFEEGEYEIFTRVGDLALVALGGLYNTRTQEFRPLRMGLARYLFAADSQSYEVDIDLTIPLSASTHFKFIAPPVLEPGPSTHRVNLYLDLGFDGVFGPMRTYSSTGDLIEADRIAHLRGELEDASYSLTARIDNNGRLPLVETYAYDLTELDRTHDLDALPAPVDFITPTQGGRPTNGLVQWEPIGSTPPDLHYVFLEDFQGAVVWEAFVAGDATGLRFPDFPDFSHLPPEERPVPYPGGTYFLVVYGIKKEGVSADNFAYSDLSGDWQGIAVNEVLMTF
ncbi:hypothetical protein FRC98_04835 [Lujinxingia vulgaris]|uniref:IPT/TIG domain-containing protein n=1 Tax=Lujinxingia vulgaris TaxID=2600176 RepID=A0A5C6XA39_9DELT|nr:IPT/TIG domain-containing protein [Lujinxingia vulgaris]TXD38226.1 hypothetical protein FRC98_04835 [Lujinxingia vulgaris]